MAVIVFTGSVTRGLRSLIDADAAAFSADHVRAAAAELTNDLREIVDIALSRERVVFFGTAPDCPKPR